MQLEEIRQFVQPEMDATNRAIDAALQTNIILARQLSTHLINNGGKRIRPLLVLLSAKAFHYQKQQHITLAAISELLHSATLLHDDVIDASELRRGKSTANTLWGNKASILVGDWLVTKAFQMLSTLGQSEKAHQTLMQIAAQAASKTIEGEIEQLQNIANLKLTEQTYLKILEHKTGQLFEMAAITGPILCDANNEIMDIMQEYGKHVGIAFQLIDDALDYAGTDKELGKNVGDDFKEEKLTLPLIYTLQHCNNAQKKLILEMFNHKKELDIKIVQSAIEETHAIHYTNGRAKQHADLAINVLTRLPSTVSTEGLENLVQYIIERSQ